MLITPKIQLTMNKKFTLFFYAILLVICANAQVVITNTGVPYNQDFNSLALSGTANTTLPTGWSFVETGTGGNTSYAADNGSTNSGNTYSYGATAATDRAFGSLQSGTVVPTIGANFTNNSGTIITSLTISYAGEQWRLGLLGRPDKLDFQYSLDATLLNNGSWLDVDALDFNAPVSAGTVGLLDGNSSLNKTNISFTITGLTIAPGSSFWIKWNDFNATSSDDGLAIDDLSILFNGSILPACTEPVSQPTSLNFTSTPTSITGSFTAASPAAGEYLVIRSTASSLSADPVDGQVYTAGQTIGGGSVVTVISGTSFTDVNLSASTLYYYFIYSRNNEDCSGGPNYLQAGALSGSTTTQAIPACVTPAGAASGLVLTPANTFIAGSFSGVAGANRYLVVISASASLSANPLNGTTYTAGQAIGGGTVVGFGSSTSFTATGLTANTPYFLFVFAANAECTGAPFYNTVALSGTATTTNTSTGIPAGFYNAANGLTCQPLKTALKNISSTGYNSLSYTPGVWEAYQYTDIKPGTANLIWDIYTDDNNPAVPETYNFTYGTNQCGNYNSEGDCYNREHTTPKSWFNDASPMYSDVHHLLPTDGWVNNKRGNFPYGDVTAATYTSIDNQSKLGTGNNFGYTGTVFEPHPAFKGDLARIALYMATRYEDQVISQNWAGNAEANPAMLTAAEETDAAKRRLQIYESWFLQTMVKWHNEDPVSQKEIDRNNAIYYQSGQSNRNPFVDHPEYVYLVWQCAGVVPVTLIDFVSVKQNEAVLLKWYATQETNFRKYEVERSTDATNFFKIGEVAGRNLANYSFTDNNLPAGSIVYYRLKMVDLDGTYSYSKTVATRLNNNFSNALVYPNPTTDALNIKLTQALATGTTLVITDVTGRLLKQQNVSRGQFTISVDVATLPAGRYFIKIRDQQAVINQSFVIIK
jgi:endonuclease I